MVTLSAIVRISDNGYKYTTQDQLGPYLLQLSGNRGYRAFCCRKERLSLQVTAKGLV